MDKKKQMVRVSNLPPYNRLCPACQKRWVVDTVVRRGGAISIELERCKACESKKLKD